MKDAEATVRAREDAQAHLEVNVHNTRDLDASARRRVDAVRASGPLESKAGKLAGEAFDRMVAPVEKTVTKGLAAFEISVPPNSELKRAIADRRAENVALIKDTTRQVRSQIVDVLEGASPGTRWEDIVSQIAERGSVSESRAELIARDQCLSTAADINRIQATRAGFTSYLWSTSNDQDVRPEHEEREGQEFEYDDPPEDGNPGEPVQCRCIAIPFGVSDD